MSGINHSRKRLPQKRCPSRQFEPACSWMQDTTTDTGLPKHRIGHDSIWSIWPHSIWRHRLSGFGVTPHGQGVRVFDKFQSTLTFHSHGSYRTRRGWAPQCHGRLYRRSTSKAASKVRNDARCAVWPHGHSQLTAAVRWTTTVRQEIDLPRNWPRGCFRPVGWLS